MPLTAPSRKPVNPRCRRVAFAAAVFLAAMPGLPQANPSVMTPKAVPRIGAANPDYLLPIRSPGLTPGTVNPRSLEVTFTRPLFLIGSDSRSRRWLSHHRNRLLELNAIGLLVQAETAADLRAIGRIADGLQIVPASGSSIAKAVGVSHYPVLIGSTGLEQ